jgi:FkbM family methyltransferase
MISSNLVKAISHPLKFRGIPRLLFATRHWFLGAAPRLFDMGGFQMMLDPNDYFQCMMFYGRYGLDILRIFENHVHPGDTVLDIGAQIGFFALHLGKAVGRRGHVYAFEPDPRPVEYLKASLAASEMDWVQIRPIAIAAKEGAIPFFLSPVLGWSTGVKASHLTGLRKIIVPTIPLDLMVERGEIPDKIRLIKIDVEGFEMEVLRGLRKTLETVQPILIVEINPGMLAYQESSPAELFRFLTSLGYRIFTTHLCPLSHVATQETIDVLCLPRGR